MSNIGEIKGVIVKRLIRHSDERGFFEEIVRDDENLLEKFGQMSCSKTNSGVIKAFHYHESQDDIWFFPVGNVRVVLHDLREKSLVEGITQIIFTGEDNPMVILIPRMVAHGYQVLGNKKCIIVYLTTKSYDPISPDEKRISYDNLDIGFNWAIINK
jgi:dTDP-4-dehydrorhamnose 3,5-epimerase